MTEGELAFLDARAELARLEAWAAVHAAAFPDEPWGVDALARLLALPGAFGVLAPATGAPAGCALVTVPGPEAELLTLGVAPAARRRGLGQSLVAAACGRAAGLGAQRLVLEVAADNSPAQQLYARFDFAACGRRPGYYRGGDGTARDALVLARALPSPHWRAAGVGGSAG